MNGRGGGWEYGLSLESMNCLLMAEGLCGCGNNDTSLLAGNNDDSILGVLWLLEAATVCGLSGIFEPPGVVGLDSGGSILIGCSKLSRAFRLLFLLTVETLSASSLARPLLQ